MSADAENVLPQPRPIAYARARKIGWRIFRLLIISYIAVLGFLFSFQKMLIFPGHNSQGQVAARVTPATGSELIYLTTKSGDKIAALFGAALDKDGKLRADAAQRPTLIYFYGNAMCVNDCRVEFGNFRKLGMNVIIGDYTGYGMSEGGVSEQGCYETADALYDYLLARNDIDKNKIVAAGWSLGSAVAIDLASRRPIAALAAFSGFSSIKDMAAVAFPMLPIPGFIIRHRFESEKKLATIGCPVFISHGKRDSIIPYTMSERMARAARGEVTTHFVNGADHGDIFDVGGPELWRAIAEFFAQIK